MASQLYRIAVTLPRVTCRHYIHVEHLYRNMPSQSTHPDKTPVLRNVRCLANRQNQQKRGPSGNSQLPPPMRRVSVPAGERDSSQGGSSVRSTIQGQNSTPRVPNRTVSLAFRVDHIISVLMLRIRQLNTNAGTNRYLAPHTASRYFTARGCRYIADFLATDVPCVSPLCGTVELRTSTFSFLLLPLAMVR